MMSQIWLVDKAFWLTAGDWPIRKQINVHVVIDCIQVLTAAIYFTKQMSFVSML